MMGIELGERGEEKQDGGVSYKRKS